MALFDTCKTLASLALLPFYAHSTSSQDDNRPYTIPALKSWQKSDGTYVFGANSRVVLRDMQLIETGSVFADDLKQLTGMDIPVVSDDNGQVGDIVLVLGSTYSELGEQGYRMEVGDWVTVEALTDDGIFYGTRTLLQLFNQHFTIPGGVAIDWPAYPQRSLMVDVGRQYFSIPWLESHFRELAYLKYNYFHLHLSDNYGFRLESERHPEIVSAQHYSKAEIRELHTLARKYHIMLVPEIDVPGHLDAVLASHPELVLKNTAGLSQPGDLDLAKEEAYTFVAELLEEYIPLFSGPYWHLGADEYLLHGGSYEDFPQLEQAALERYGPQAISKDIYLGFVNWAHEIVKSHDKIMRVWSDGMYGGSAVTPATDSILYEHWVSWGPSPREIVERGMPIVNSNIHYLYYVPGSDIMRADPEALYENFEPHMFCLDFNRLDDVDGIILPESAPSLAQDLDALAFHPLNLGAKLHIWCDTPGVETEGQIALAIAPALRALAQKNWGSPLLVPLYEGFKSVIQATGHAPGYVVEQ